MNPYAAQINIDGSCPKNPGGSGGLAGILEMPDSIDKPVVIFQDGYESTTNNRMEMKALIYALKWVKKNASELKKKEITEVEIWSDSDYTLQRYKHGEILRSNNWIGNNGIHVKNINLVKEIISLKNSVKFSCKPQWIKNKSTEIARNVDRLAKEASRKAILKKDTDFIKPKVSKTSVSGPTHQFDAKGQEIIIKIFEHGLVANRKNSAYKIKFEISENGKIEKYFAYASNKIESLLHRGHYYKALFNNSNKNAIIESVVETDESDFTLCE